MRIDARTKILFVATVLIFGVTLLTMQPSPSKPRAISVVSRGPRVEIVSSNVGNDPASSGGQGPLSSSSASALASRSHAGGGGGGTISPLLAEADIPKAVISRGYADTCTFSNCPSKDGPFLYMLTSHRNRGASYNRWVRTVAIDAFSSENNLDPGCICLTVADYNDNVYGPTINAALDDWPGDRHVVNVTGDFSRAGGFQHLMDNVITTPPEQSLLFFVDADMVSFPGFINRLVENTKLGVQAFAPVCWSTSGKDSDWYDGQWRIFGSGMISFYLSDLQTVLGGEPLPMADRVEYGKEDFALSEKLRQSQKQGGVGLYRDCAPDLWHLYHAKTKWTETIDGVHAWMSDIKRKNPWKPSKPWHIPLPYADGPARLLAANEYENDRCSSVRLGRHS